MRSALLSALFLATALTGCSRPAPLSVTDAWVRLPAVAGRPAGGYATLNGGAADATLIAVASPSAKRTELHETVSGGMRPVRGMAVPAGGEAKLAPGGYHIMLFDPDPRLAPGGTMALRFSFANGRTLDATARLVGPADPAP